MKLKTLGSNRTEVEVNGKTVFFSYNTPVAYCQRGVGFFRTTQKYSVTTSKHITQWLEGAKAKEVPQEQIDEVLK